MAGPTVDQSVDQTADRLVGAMVALLAGQKAALKVDHSAGR